MINPVLSPNQLTKCDIEIFTKMKYSLFIKNDVALDHRNFNSERIFGGGGKMVI